MKNILIIIAILGLAQWWFKDPTINLPSNDVSFGYVVNYSGNSSNKDNLPMLVALHGNGDKAKHFYETALDQLNIPARIILLKGPLSYGGGDAWPYNPAEFEQYGEALSEAVNLLTIKFPTKGKPVLMGFSGGGMMAYYQAVKHGNTYSYIFPVSGQLSINLLGDQSSKTGAKVHAYHGKSDSVVSFGGGKKALEILQSKNVKVKFTAFDGGHHGIFKNMKSEITEVIEQKLQSL